MPRCRVGDTAGDRPCRQQGNVPRSLEIGRSCGYNEHAVRPKAQTPPRLCSGSETPGPSIAGGDQGALGRVSVRTPSHDPAVATDSTPGGI